MKPKELLKRAEKATQGKWRYDYGNWNIETTLESRYRDGICGLTYDDRYTMDGDTNPIDTIDDAEYIAAACPHNLIPILKAAMKMAEALENARPNGWRDYVGEEACKVALYIIELTIDGALTEWEKLK